MERNLIAQLRAILSQDGVLENPTEVLRDLVDVVNTESGAEASRPVQELVLRALEHRGDFGELATVVDSLARQRGLYPYLDPETLGAADWLAYEAHRAVNLEELVFHHAQAQIYTLLINGENVILSAPTSFGKSVLIDALLATGKYSQVVIVVPTIALIDETRRRLGARFGGSFKIITHPGQALEERNVFVLTQERVLDFEELGKPDLFVIDEFYKLDPRQDRDRALLLNEAFYRLHRTGAQFYLLGPNIRELPLALPDRLNTRFIATDYTTVAANIIRVSAPKNERLEYLVELATRLADPTLVYCASPASARRVVTALIGALPVTNVGATQQAADWIANEYYPEWAFARGLRHGIGLHHGRLPRSLAQYVVRAFNGGQLRHLVCTSTLIEGVNTKAKNVIIYDHRIAKRSIDFFTFNNIKGRSGRMFEHFVGNAFLFSDPPHEEFPFVDVPAFTQSQAASASLLIQLDERDLSDLSVERLRMVREQTVLPLSVLKANRGIEPESQIALAARLQSDPDAYIGLAWSGLPNWQELVLVCELIWEYLLPESGIRPGVTSAKQLAYKVNQFRNSQSVSRLILKELASMEPYPDADEAVETILDFIRYWATFHFPRCLMALDRIQKAVFDTLGRRSGDYSVFASKMENAFVSVGLAALEEYGIPIQVAQKLAPLIGAPESVDDALMALRAMDRASLESLLPFERSLVEDTLMTI